MSVKVARDRFIVSSVSKCTALYQQLLSGTAGLKAIGNRLVQEAELAQSFRQTDRLEELGTILSNFPLEEFRVIGKYHLGWCMYRRGEEVRGTFEEVLEKSKTYKARALMTLAALEARKGNYEAELEYFIESLKFPDSITTTTKILRGIAVIKAKEGFHTSALR